MSKQKVEELYRLWYKPVRAWIRKRRDIPRLWIEDIAQEVFIRLMKYDPDIHGSIAGYIFQAANNVAIEWTKRAHLRKSHSTLENEIESGLGLAESPETQLAEIQDNQDKLLRVELAMSKLKSRQLLILMLHVYEGRTYNNIAKDLGLTYRIVLRDLTHAYAQLRNELGDLVDIYTPNEEISDERNIDRKKLPRPPDTRLSKSRPATTYVGPIGRIRDDRPAPKRVPGRDSVKRSGTGG